MVSLTALAVAERLGFLFLQNLTGLTAGNLSGHLTRLEEAGLIRIHKEIAGKRLKTRLSLTESGRKAINRRWQRLNELRIKTQASASNKPDDTR